MKIKTRTKISCISAVIIAVLLAEVLIANYVSKTYAATVPEKYDLRDEIDITVKNQGQNSLCLYMSRSTAVETAIKLGQKNGKYQWFKETPVFSAVASKNSGNFVAVSIDRTDKLINEYSEGKFKSEQDFLNNVSDDYESMMEYREQLYKLEPSLDTKNNGERDPKNITNFKIIGRVLKEYSDGKVIYKDDKNTELTSQKLQETRAKFKETIMNTGSVISSIGTEGLKAGANGDMVCFSTKITSGGNHSVSIIGWDDNYPKENFPEDMRPSSNGAYLVLNSWGSDWGDNGTFWVSYEDIYIELVLMCVDEMIEYKDITAPEFSKTVSEDGKKITINVEDLHSSGVDESSVKYKWTNHNVKPESIDETWTALKNGDTIDNYEDKYLWLYAKDNVGNETLLGSGGTEHGLIIDNVPNGKSTKDVVLSIKDADTLVGENEKLVIIASSDTISDEELKAMDKELETNEHVFTINKEGKHTIYFSRVDRRGRESLAQKVEVWIEKDGGDEEEVPTEPEEPEEPVQPGEDEDKPTEPEKPEEPGEDEDKPTEPEEPEEPTQPGEDENKPTEPAKPEEPVQPGEGEDRPVEPEEPGEEEEKEKPAEPEKPEEPEEPTQPGEDENKPTEPAKPEEPNKEEGDNKEEHKNEESLSVDTNKPLVVEVDKDKNKDSNVQSVERENSYNVQNPNQSNSGLPQTGSNSEVKYIVMVMGTVLLFVTIHTYRKIKNS